MSEQPRVVFVNRYFHPDHSATSQMVSDLAFHLASRGWKVGAITSRQRYDDASAQLASREMVSLPPPLFEHPLPARRGEGSANVQITRVWSTRFGRGWLPGRAVDYLTFYWSAFLAMRREREAIIVALTDPPLLSFVATLASNRVVNWSQDVFPEVATALGVKGPGVLKRVRDWSLRRARTNVVLSDGMARRLNAPRMEVQHNWADAALRPHPRTDDRFTIAYSGNLGRAHEFETIVGAIRALPEVQFVFTGGGAQLAVVREATRELGNVSFRPYAPREQLGESLSAADAHFVTLQPALDGLIVPSKFYGILAVARPVLCIGAGELAAMVREHGIGIAVDPGDVTALVEGIRSLAADRAKANEMGSRGRALYEERFAPPVALANWERILTEASR
ncbi:MAG TPA: glycosyltransferase family 4 protein [Thermoanaerobaculia bacterium]|jgi:glycosyltransferase involved in cell wall biosynthesis|nr:glycosyltransferase family 4 protein [Thermoanaerobaculia bacterium]